MTCMKENSRFSLTSNCIKLLVLFMDAQDNMICYNNNNINGIYIKFQNHFDIVQKKSLIAVKICQHTKEFEYCE